MTFFHSKAIMDDPEQESQWMSYFTFTRTYFFSLQNLWTLYSTLLYYLIVIEQGKQDERTILSR